MRKDAKTERTAKETARVEGYHRSHHEHVRLFNSDRSEELKATSKAYGFEIETACNWMNVHNAGTEGSNAIGALLQEVVLKEFPKDLFRWEKDGSISGAEVVSQCMTKAFIRNHYREFKNLYNVYLPRFGFTPSYDCGMHTNISLAVFGSNEKDQLERTRKLYYFINKNYSLACGLLNRDHRYTGYCGRMNYENARFLNPMNYYSDHSVSFNWGHFYEDEPSARRIELRLVGPQTTFGQFRNTVETIFALVDAVKRLSWADLDDIKKVFVGCNKYVLSRLEKCRDNGLITQEMYESIAEASDRETEYL